MWLSMFKVAAATAAFGVVHSLFASSAAKRLATGLLGERNRNGLYRVAFIGQSLATARALARYVGRQPNRELYRIRGPLALLTRAAQAGAAVYAVAAAEQVGLRRITGVKSFQAWLGDGPVPPEPPAQGPALDEIGRRHAAGPFAWSRHPLNFSPLPILWLWPRMTTNLLAFNAMATLYLILGSRHEEQRLREAYGEDYDSYARSGVPFYWPLPIRSGQQPLSRIRGPISTE